MTFAKPFIAIALFVAYSSSAVGQPNKTSPEERQIEVLRYLNMVALTADASDALLDSALSEISEAHGVAWWEVFDSLLALEDISNSLLEQQYVDAVEKLAIHVGEGAIRPNATTNRLLGGVDIARLSALPIQPPLSDLAQHMEALGFEYQRRQYYRLRSEFDFTLDDVLAGKEPTDVALYDDSGFLRWLDVPEENAVPPSVWHPGLDWTPESLYGFLDALYEAEQSASRFDARKRAALAVFSDQLSEHNSLQQAQPVVWDASIVVAEDADFPRLPCLDVTYSEGCFRDLGLSEATIDFARALKATYPDLYSSFLPIEFRELGTFDFVLVPMAGASGGSYPLAVDGNARKITIILRMDDAPLEARFMDGASTRILARERQASAWSAFVVGHRILPDEAQRFVVATNITTSCRACPLAGIGVSYVDVSSDGTVRSRDDIGIMDVGNVPNAIANRPWPSGLSPLVLPVRQLQYLLNLRGYNAGSMDGAIGPQTRQALAEFQNEQAIDASRRNADRVTNAALSDTSTFFKNGFEGLYTSPPRAEVGTAVTSIDTVPFDTGDFRANTIERWLGHFQVIELLLNNGYTAEDPMCFVYSDAHPITIRSDSLGYYESHCTLVPPILGDGVLYQGERHCNSEGELRQESLSIALGFNTTYGQDMLTFRYGGRDPVSYLRCRMPEDDQSPAAAAPASLALGGAAPESGDAPEVSQAAGGLSDIEACAQIENRQIRLECFDAAFRGSAEATSPPPASSPPVASFTDAQGFTLMRHLQSRHQSVTLDTAGCAIVLRENRVIQAYNPGSFAEGGGWAGFMGEPSEGRIRRIGSRTDTIVVPVGNLDFQRTGRTEDTRFVFTLKSGAPILSTSIETTNGETETRYRNRASRNHTITLSDGTNGPLPDIDEALQLLRAFNEVCSTR